MSCSPSISIRPNTRITAFTKLPMQSMFFNSEPIIWMLSRLDDRLRSFPAHGLLLQERLQPARLAGGQRVAHLLLSSVSPSVIRTFLPDNLLWIAANHVNILKGCFCPQFQRYFCGEDSQGAPCAQTSACHQQSQGTQSKWCVFISRDARNYMLLFMRDAFLGFFSPPLCFCFALFCKWSGTLRYEWPDFWASQDTCGPT